MLRVTFFGAGDAGLNALPAWSYTYVHLGRCRGRGLHEAAFLGEVVAIDPAHDAVTLLHR